MKGAIAAGHPLTAEAGAAILAEGGNAVDACLAAAFASWVTESPLTGPGGGGFLLVHRAHDRKDRLLDFFVAMPGKGLRGRKPAEMETIDVDFDGSSSQVFLVGPASCAVPGVVAGLEAAHRAYATVPWPRLLEPAIELARNGVELTPRAGVPARDPRPHPPAHARGSGDLRAGRTAGAGREGGDVRPRAHARDARQGWSPRAVPRATSGPESWITCWRTGGP